MKVNVMPTECNLQAPGIRLLLIGPKPPPWHGTSVKFEIFSGFAQQELGQDAVDVVDTQTGDKAIASVVSVSSLRGYVRIIAHSIRKGYRADIIVVFGSQRFATIFGSIAAVMFGLMGKRVYISLFGGSYDRYLEELPPAVYRAVRIMLGNARGIIVETQHLQQALTKVLPGKLYYVPNFRQSSLKVHEYPHSENSAIRFLYVGVIRREKGIAELLNAFNQLEQHVRHGLIQRPVTLDLYGPVYDTPQDHVDLELAMQTPGIRIHGEVSHDHALKAYTEADIFVYPSYWPSEGHSGAVIEALMHGIPVIATNWSASPELIRDNENGLLCSPRDTFNLAACMERIVRDVELRKRLAEGAKRSAREFDADHTCAILLQIIMG